MAFNSERATMACNKEISISALTSKTILITRPRDQAKNLAHLISAAGGRAILCPSIRIESLVTKQQLSTIREQFETVIRERLATVNYAIFVSANAVAAIGEILQSLTPSSKWRFLAVGASTAAALHKLGISDVTWPPTDASSAGLLQLSLLQNCQGQRILLFCGENTNPTLATELHQRGATVIPCIVYRRVREPLPTLPAHADAIVFTSREMLMHFYEQLPDARLFIHSTLVVISSKMLEQAKNLGAKSVVVALNASDEAILQALSNLWIT